VKRKYRPGDVFNELTFVDYAENGKAKFMCSCGTESLKYIHNVVKPGRTTKTCGDRTKHPRTSVPAYSTVHSRVIALYGPAADYLCICLCNRAAEWSYEPGVGGNATELVCPDTGKRYNADLSMYYPRSVKCHKAVDKKRRILRKRLFGRPDSTTQHPVWSDPDEQRVRSTG